MAFAKPVEKDGFSYAGEDFYCQSSNSNRHRRATVPELRAHFSGKDPQDRPAHWYEAQLIHYGLPPSKTKGTAHKRLFDAVNKGGLCVPPHIIRIESELKRMWLMRGQEVKKVVEASAAARKSDLGRTNAPASSQRPSPRRPMKLGLLNGRYDVACPYLEFMYPEHEAHMSLTVTMGCY